MIFSDESPLQKSVFFRKLKWHMKLVEIYLLQIASFLKTVLENQKIAGS